MEWPKIEKEKMYLQWSFFRCWMVHWYEKIRIEQNYSQARQPLNKKCQNYSQIWTSVRYIQSCVWHWPYWKVKTTVITTCNIPVIYRSPERSVMSHNFCCFISFGWISRRGVVNCEIASSKPNPRSFKNKCSVHALLSLIYSLFYFFTKKIFRDNWKRLYTTLILETPIWLINLVFAANQANVFVTKLIKTNRLKSVLNLWKIKGLGLTQQISEVSFIDQWESTRDYDPMELNIDNFLSFKIMMHSVLDASFIIVITVDMQQLRISI